MHHNTASGSVKGTPHDRLGLYETLRGVSFSRNGSANNFKAEECPFCGGGKFYVNADTGQYQCHNANSCGEKGNTVTFVRRHYELSLRQTTDDDYRRLKAKRGYALQTSKDHGLAWDRIGECWLIPYRNPSGEVVSLQRYYPDDGRKLWLPDLGSWLYGVDRLAEADDRADKTLFVCEGALDAIALDAHLTKCKVRKRYDVLAVPAANTFKPEWASFLAGYKEVRLCLDNDKAGRDGQERIARITREAKAGAKLLALRWPNVKEQSEDGTEKDKYPEGYDVSDLIRDGAGVVNFTKEHCVKVGAGERSIRFVRGDEVAVHKTEWFWPLRIPFGSFCSLSGEKGTGKSLLCKYLAARATKGEPLPDQTEGVRAFDVIYLTSEDSASQVVDLVKLHGGDDKRLHVHDVADADEMLDIIEAKEELEAEINSLGVRLVIVDALNSFAHGRIKSDSQARRTLTGPLQRLARRTGACIIGIRNWGRATEGTASQKALGATSLSDVARCTMNTVEVAGSAGEGGPDGRRFRLEFERISDAPPQKPVGFSVKDLSGGVREHAHRRQVVWEKAITPDARKRVVADVMAEVQKGGKKR